METTRVYWDNGKENGNYYSMWPTLSWAAFRGLVVKEAASHPWKFTARFHAQARAQKAE